ncbi:RidA family protein [Sinirhodobacter populi]|uniref:RidA family protein n=1 Tax=Paenirhodobacter populi TaxID=2306993 RepID=A0A443K2F0_9RHOB|nr:RidA family protein [Sinirhodobacter populi]RWR26937.1 RidA family protein [Sinirhodobacter populi]
MTAGDQPAPQGLYVPAVRYGNMIQTAGMTPRERGVLRYAGRLSASAEPEDYRDAVALACGNALRAAQGQLRAGERLVQVVNLMVYIAAEPGFSRHSQLADHASAFLRATLGAAAIGVCAAVGVASLPGDAPVELQLLALAGPG